MSQALKIDQRDQVRKVKMTNDEYHAHHAIGSTSLKPILVSPAHFIEHQKNKPKDTPAKILGQAIHARVLEKHIFDSEYIVMPEFSGKGSVAARDEWKLLNAGKTQITEEQFEIANAVANSVYSKKVSRELLSQGHAEEAYFWTDAETGIELKCKPDYLRNGHIIVDVKSTIDVTPYGFSKEIKDWGYHISAALYLDGVSIVTGRNFDTFMFMAVEKKAPYGVKNYVLDADSIELGRNLYRKALRLLKECKSKNEWPCYSDEIEPITVPSYAFQENQ